THCRRRTAWEHPHRDRGEGPSPATGRNCKRLRRTGGMPPPLVSLAQPQIRALVSRVPMPSENLAGRTIAGYRLLERVGEGGTAEVYRAEHPERGACAFKVLRSRLASDPTVVKRFLREAGYGSRVQHPGVVRTYDYGEAAHAHRVFRRDAQVRRTGSPVGRAGGRAGGHLQPRDDHLLAPDGPAPPHGAYAAGVVPAAADPAAPALEPGGAGQALPAGP